MIAQRKDVSPPVAFMILSDMLANQAVEAVASRYASFTMGKTIHAFSASARPKKASRNFFASQSSSQKSTFRLFSYLRKQVSRISAVQKRQRSGISLMDENVVGSIASAAKLIVSIHGKLSNQVTEQAHWMNTQVRGADAHP
uniref:AlNc14C32G2943 protein n=1 Tax=Albugo laibachii Nc14 TaxID=890382 RepID=F0W7Z3_9STRA|nr:AlNc14C32G2943 [Albugo laibachii Nc14]|eukprot:CCA17246.1 AlNc14C32G2943 [Albugo laibachii Nc14]